MTSLNSFLSSIILWILIPFGIILPLPTWSSFDIGKDITWLTTSAIFCWNIIVIYVLIGLFISVSKNFKKYYILYAPLLFFYLGTSIIYINTILDERRKVMILPFAMILAAIGIRDWNYRYRVFVSWLFFISIIISGFIYTYIRMKGHGVW
jgi:hypothetical protein